MKTAIKAIQYRHFQRRNGIAEMGNGVGVMLAVVLVIVGLAGAIYINSQTGNPLGLNVAGKSGNSVGPSGCANSYTPPAGYQCTTLPVQYAVLDPEVPPGTANGINGAQVSVIDPTSLASVDVPSTTASTGLVTGSKTLTTGMSEVCKVSTSAYVTEYLPCTIPPISSSGGLTTSTIYMPLYEIKTNTYQWSVAFGSGGTTWSDTNAIYSFVANSVTSVQATFTVTANSNNEGYLSSFDITKKVNNLAIWALNDGGSLTTTISSGCMYSTTRSNTQYCQVLLPDGYTTINPSYATGASAVTAYFPVGNGQGNAAAGQYQQAAPASQTYSGGSGHVSGSLSQNLQGNTQVPGTAVSFSLTFTAGSLSNAKMSWTDALYFYADPVYFDGQGGQSGNGNYGGDQSQATLTGGNSPTITLYN